MITESILMLAFLAGIISFLSPCIVPMIMVYLSLITGLTTDELVRKQDHGTIRRNVVINTILFVIGFSLIFILAGSAAGFAGSFLRDYADIMTKVGGILIILMGLHVLGVLNLSFISRFSPNRDPSSVNPIGYFGSFLVGVFFAIFCSHCIAPTLYSMLIFAGTTSSVQSGALIMALFSLGLAVPYLIVALGITSALEHIERVKKHIRTFSIVNGIILIIIGVLMLTGNFTYLVQVAMEIIPFKLPVGMGV